MLVKISGADFKISILVNDSTTVVPKTTDKYTNTASLNKIFNPRIAWTDEYKYMIQATKLRDMFVNNYKQYIDPKFTDYSEYGPK